MRDIVERIARLSPAQREILARRSTTRHSDAVRPALPVTERKKDARIPLSCLQEQLWLHDQLRPESLAYNIRFSYRLKGPLNEKALNSSVTEIVRRHEALRAFYPMVEGSPVQSFVEAAAIQITVEQINAGTPSDRKSVV